MRYGLAAAIAGTAMMLASPAMAEKNAVSQFNAKVEGFGGILSEGETYGGAGSVALPILEGIGLQVDGLAGSLDGEFTYGLGAHLFWRAPSTGLFGLVFSYMDASDLYDVWRIGAETEWYFDDLTLGGTLGYQDVDVSGLEGAFFAGVEASYYVDDDVKLTLGVTGLGYDDNEDYQFGAGVEFGLGHGISIFGDGKIGTESDEAIMGGIRISLWGEGDTLKRRDRYDDPGNVLTRNIRETDLALEVLRDRDEMGGGNGGGGGGGLLGGLLP